MRRQSFKFDLGCVLYQRFYGSISSSSSTLQLRHNGQDGVSNHQPHDCLLNRLFKRRSKKTSKLRATGLRAGNSPGTGSPVNSPHKGPVTRKMFPFDDVIMLAAVVVAEPVATATVAAVTVAMAIACHFTFNWTQFDCILNKCFGYLSNTCLDIKSEEASKWSVVVWT